MTKELRKNLALYHGQQVLIELKNGEQLFGTMCFVEKEVSHDVKLDGMFSADEISIVMVEDKEVTLEEINDIRYVGIVTDYHTKNNYMTIDNYINSASLENEELYEKLRFKEFNCMVSCHLVFGNESNNDADEDEEESKESVAVNVQDEEKISATDVCLYQAIHYLHSEMISKHCLYKISGVWKSGSIWKDGSPITSPQEKSYLLQEQEYEVYLDLGETINAEEIEDIMIAPVSNQKVKVILNSKNEFIGTVSAVNKEGFYLVAQEEESIKYKYVAFAEMEQLFYYGKITKLTPKEKVIDVNYKFKEKYVSSAGLTKKEYAEKGLVTYSTGVSKEGLIAKNIYVQEMKEHLLYGMIRPFCFYDKEYLLSGYRRIDNGICGKNLVQYDGYKKQAIFKEWEGKEENKIYVVMYTVGGVDQNGVPYAGMLKGFKRMPWDKDTVSVEIDNKTGKIIQKKVFHIPEYMRYYKDKEVDLKYTDKEDEIKSVSGKLSYNDDMFNTPEEEWCVTIHKIDEKIEIKVNDIINLVIYEKIKLTTGNGPLYYIGGSDLAFNVYNDEKNLTEKQKMLRLQTFADACKSAQWISYQIGVRYDLKRNEYKLEASNVKVHVKDVIVVEFDKDDNCAILDNKDFFNTKDNKELYKNIEHAKLESGIGKELDETQTYVAYVREGRKLGEIYFEGEAILRKGPNGYICKTKIEHLGRIEWYKEKEDFGYVIPWHYFSWNSYQRNQAKVDLRFKKSKNVNDSGTKDALNTINTVANTYDVVYKIIPLAKGIGADDIIVYNISQKNVVTDFVMPSSQVVSMVKVGETIGYEDSDNITRYVEVTEYVEEDTEEGVTVKINGAIDVLKEKIHRFGVVTKTDWEKNIGCINEEVSFSLSALEDSTYSKLRIDKTPVLLEYTCDNTGKIESAWFAIALENVLWEKGNICKYDKTNGNKELKITLDNEKTATLYVHGGFNHDINILLKKTEEVYINETVYLKKVYIYNYATEQVEPVIAEIRLETEEATIAMQMVSAAADMPKTEAADIVRDNSDTIQMVAVYYAFTKGTKKYLLPDGPVVARRIGKKVKINCKPDDTGTGLITMIDSEDVRIPLPKSEYVVSTEKYSKRVKGEQYKEKTEEELKKELEQYVKDMLDNNGKYINHSFHDVEYNYLLSTLQAASLDDKKYLYNMFLPLCVGDDLELLKEKYRKDSLDKKSCAELLMQLFDDETISWNDATSNKFVEKMMLLDSVNFDWLMTVLSKWNGTKKTAWNMSVALNLKDKTLSGTNEIENDMNMAISMLQLVKDSFDEKKEKWMDSLHTTEDKIFDSIDVFCNSVNSSKEDGLEWSMVNFADSDMVKKVIKWKNAAYNSFDAALLDTIREELQAWLDYVQQYPMQITTEVFALRAVEPLITAISKKIKELKDYLPARLTVNLLEQELYFDQNEITFYFYNGDRQTNKHVKYLPIENGNIEISLCDMDENPIGSRSFSFGKLDMYTEKNPEYLSATLNLDAEKIKKNYPSGGEFYIKISANYICDGNEYSQFNSNKRTLTLCSWKKKEYAQNPYNSNDVLPADSLMFFGRTREKKFISECLIKMENNEVSISTEPLFIYGQKRTGKSCVVNQSIDPKSRKLIREFESENSETGELEIKREIIDNTIAIKLNSPKPNENLIVKKEDVEKYLNEMRKNAPEEYEKELNGEFYEAYCNKKVDESLTKFYANYITNLYKKIMEAILDACADGYCEDFYVMHENDTNNMSEQNYETEFSGFISAFYETIGKKVNIICVIDEFTGYCEAVLKAKDPNLNKRAFAFRSDLQMKNITPIFIGHELLQKLLAEMRMINELTGRSRGVKEITELDYDDARALIVEPFVRGFNYNPYDTVCGEKVINELVQLSGLNPYILVNLCGELYSYLEMKQGKYLTQNDLEHVLEKQIFDKLSDHEQWFDSFLGEEYEDKKEQAKIKYYLRAVAESHECDENLIPRNLRAVLQKVNDPEIEDMTLDEMNELKKKLIDRKIIEEGDYGMLRIKVRLLHRYLNVIIK